MRTGGKKLRIALSLLLLLLFGFPAYRIGLYCWGSYQSRAAERALERRDFLQAGIHLRKCQLAWPRDPTPWLLAAQTARRQGDFAEAHRQLRVYKEKNGPLPALQLEHQLLRLQQGDLAEADMFLSFCNDHPAGLETPFVLEALVVGQLKALSEESLLWTASPQRRAAAASDLVRARRSVDLWLRLRPGKADQVQGLTWSGQFHDLASEYPEDVADYRKALELDPDNYAARMYLALTLIPYAPKEAAAHLERVRQLYPEKPLVHSELAKLRRSLGQLDEAKKILDEILAANPDYVSALIERGNVALDMRQFDDAERWLRRAVTLDPNDPNSHFALSRCLQLTDRAEEAKEHRQRCVAIEAEQKRRSDEMAERYKVQRQQQRHKSGQESASAARE